MRTPLNLNRITPSPLRVPRTLRGDNKRALTSFKAGVVAPLAYFPIFREDAVRRGKISVRAEMMETAELLMNAVHMNVQAWFVPYLAFPRFQGSMDILNRSYMDQAPMTGEAVIDFIEAHVKGAHGAEAIYKTMGLHADPGDSVSTAVREAYNLIWNFRANNRSPDIAERAVTDMTLAPAFWTHQNFAHIVPDFAQDVIDGEVALNVVDGSLPIRGLGVQAGQTWSNNENNVRYSDGTTANVTSGNVAANSGSNVNTVISSQLIGGVRYPAIFAELAENGITVSLSNLEVAKKTQAFAKLREQYAEHSDDWVIDMLMSGLAISDQSLKQPIMIGSRVVPFMQSKRYAMDAGNLDESATNGMTMADINFVLPRVSCGGLIMVTAECTPEQLFERQRDPIFQGVTAGDGYTYFPDYLRDELDPEKVEVVRNDYVDVNHATPAGVFGYEPLNARHDRRYYNIGGKFYRPAVDGVTDTVRQRIWAEETANPTLTANFYLCGTLQQKPFLDTTADPFETVTLAELVIEGNTVFGPPLIEGNNNYEAVLEKVPDERIELPE